MNNRRLGLALVAGLLLAVTGVVWWLWPAKAGVVGNFGGGAVQMAEPPVVQDRPGAQQAAPKVAADTPGKSSDSTRAGIREMRKSFEGAQNFRVFIQQAMERPEQGGRYYAKLAYDICFHTNRIRLPEAASIESDARRQAVAEAIRWKDRCAGVDEQVGDVTTFVRRVIAKDGPAGQDVLVSAGPSAFHSNTDTVPVPPAVALARMEAAGRLGDPWLMYEVVAGYTPMLVEALAPEVSRYLRPEWSLALAELIGCELTETCVRGRVPIMRCAAVGICADDEREYVLGTVPPDQLDAFKAARVALLAKIRSFD